MPQIEIGTTLPEWWVLEGGQEAIVQGKDWKQDGWVGMVYKAKVMEKNRPNYAGYVRWNKYGKHGIDRSLDLKEKRAERKGEGRQGE